MWVETITEGGRRFMAAWREKNVEAARHRQKITRLGKLLSFTEALNLRSDTNWPSRQVVGKSCTAARRTETCVAPRHVDASRDVEP